MSPPAEAPRLKALPLLLLVLVAATARAQWTDGASNPYGEGAIRVHLDASNLTAETMPYLDEARAALRYWEEGGNGALRWTPVFEEVATREEAELRVWFVDAPAVPCGGGFAAGCGGFLDPEEGGNVTGIAYLALQAQGSGSGEARRYVPYGTVREVVAHEVGHALGLRHSDSVSDVMYRHVTANGFADAPGDTWLQRNPTALLALVMALGVAPFLLWKGYGAGRRVVGAWRERRAMAMAPRRDGPP